MRCLILGPKKLIFRGRKDTSHFRPLSLARLPSTQHDYRPANLIEAFPSQPQYAPKVSHAMANIDSHVASVLDASHSDDEDALIASLEDSPALDAFREQRIEQLHSEFTRAKAQKNQGFGSYTEIKEEKALMDLTTGVKYAVVHFAKDDFQRCRTMDVHLEVKKIPTDHRICC
jgi:hypothetical protein